MPNKKGFSLIELLITLVILGIIISIAYPTYTNHILKTRRSQAKVSLLDLAARLEQYYVLHQAYQGATLANLNFNQANNYYYYQIQTNENDFIISAVPQKTQVKDSCGTLTYNEKGEKLVAGKIANNHCW